MSRLRYHLKSHKLFSMTKKKCSRCKKPKALSEFHNDKTKPDGKTTRCKSCNKAVSAAWRKADPEHARALWREASRRYGADAQRRFKYGIGKAEYDQMKEDQGCRCAICGLPEAEIKGRAPGVLCVDHDADTGQVRGLLCDRCNVGIGTLAHDIGRLHAAIEYLLEAEAKKVVDA